MRGPLVVVGDSFLDRDISGTAERLCPDAPVPVVDSRTEFDRPGGAALAALLAAGHGREVVLVTALGADPAGERVTELLAGRVRVLAAALDGATPEKIRIRVRGQSLLRLDRGGDVVGIGALGEAARDAVLGAAAVLVSDYGRGMTSHPEIRDVIARAVRRHPVVWDPHPRGAAPVAGVCVVTPNAEEAARFAGAGRGHDAGLRGSAAAAAQLRRDWAVTAVAVTLGAGGALLVLGEPEPLVVPPRVVTHGGDTCGAGDAFAASVASGLADGEVLSEAVVDAVRRASAFVAAGGASTVGGLPFGTEAVGGECELDPGAVLDESPVLDGVLVLDDRSILSGVSVLAEGSVSDAASVIARVRAAGGTVVATGGCFDLLHPGHIATLRAARRLGDCLVVCLNSDDSVRRLKGPDRPVNPAGDRAHVLSAISGVDAVVVFGEDTPERVLTELRPDIWVKGGDYAGAEVPEAALVRSWGGQAVVVPYVDGRSSTRILAAARRGART